MCAAPRIRGGRSSAQAERGRGGGSVAAGLTESSASVTEARAGDAAISASGTSSPSTGKRPDGQPIAHSGVQQPIFSWSTAIPASAPCIEQPADGAAKAGPGVLAREKASKMAKMSLVTLPQLGRDAPLSSCN